MPRYGIKIEYNGEPFYGWQRQNDLPSVQGTIEQALYNLTEHKIAIQGAGRTDAGVHATGQVAHFDCTRHFTPFRLSEALNYYLRKSPISIVDSAIVCDDFHARFHAIKRRYLFRLISRRAPTVIDNGWVWHIKHSLNLDHMRMGAKALIGNHDFTTFRSSICQAQSPIKTLDELNIVAIPLAYGTEYQFTICARSFLHNQVRSFVGTLVQVGSGRWKAHHVKEALLARDRSACGPVSPPQGLYLTEVTYPNDPFKS